MKTKLISMLLALCMVFSVMTPAVFAQDNGSDTYTNDNVTLNEAGAESGSRITLPADESWTVNDAALSKILWASQKGKAFEPYNGLSGYGEWKNKTGQGTVKYTHTNGTKYTFTDNWTAGSGGPTNRSLIFTPKQACIVTVVYKAQSGRPVKIYQGDELLASGEEGADKDGNAATLIADVEDPSAGNVIIYGGSSDKQIYGIFADYYDPSIIVCKKVSGKINYTGSNDTSKAKIVFTDQKDQTRYDAPFASTYSVDLRQNRNYKISIEVDGAVSESLALTLDTNNVSVAKSDKTFDLKVVDIALTNVIGDVVVHDIYNDGTTVDLSEVKLTFKAKDDPTYTYETSINDNKINVKMMPNHEYEVTATGGAIGDYTMSKLSGSYLMAAGDMKPFKNILFTENTKAIPFKAEVTVGADKEYKKVGDAITAIKAMTGRPIGEKGRVSVLIDPGTYIEQVIVDSPYITLKAANPTDKPKITFYYGIGYLYYSADGGYYSEDKAVQKTELGSVTRWGAVCRVTGQNFIAENIIFENSFSCRVTPEELADNVTSAPAGWYGDVSGKPKRTTAGYDAQTKNAVERAAAFAGDAPNWELYNCEFISSQDTFYTGYNGYVKNCYIEGGTDYLYGGNSVVFEDCILAWHGYSDQAVGGYLTACKSSDKPVAGTPNLNANGYLIKNCTITNSKYYPKNKFAAGSWGRNWGGANCQVVLQGITLDGVGTPGAWNEMSGKLSNSILFVDDVKKADGTVIDTKGTAFNPNGTMASKKYTPMSLTTYFGNWIPSYYEGEVNASEYVTTWIFGRGNGAPKYKFEGEAGVGEIIGATNAKEDQILKIDATVGKFDNSSRTDEWAQVNVGTKFTIPVSKDSVVNFGVYNKNGKLKIGETQIDPSKPYTVEENVTSITVEVIGLPNTADPTKPIAVEYISQISVSSPAEAPPAGIKYKNGIITVNTGDASLTDGVLIAITYDENKKVEKIGKFNFKFEDGIGAIKRNLSDGDVLMVWNSLDGMSPILASYTYDASAVEDEPTTEATTASEVTTSSGGSSGEEGTTSSEATTSSEGTTSSEAATSSEATTTGGGDEPNTEGSTEEATVNLVADFTNLSTKSILTADEISNKSEVSFGLNAEGSRVDVGAKWTFAGFKYHSEQHGLNPGTITVKVPGPVKITWGTCAWGSDVTVKNGDDIVATKSTNTGQCYHSDTKNNVVVMYYSGGETTLTLSGGSYAPYIAVKSVDKDTIRTISFDKGTETDLQGTLPTEFSMAVGDTFKAPAVDGLSVTGKSCTGWSDGTNKYAPGDTITVSDNMTLTPVFVSAFTVHFSKDVTDLTVEGTIIPDDIVVQPGGSFTIPAVNHTLYVEGKTLTGWNDGTTTYGLGDTVNNVSKDMTLTPAFTDNPQSLISNAEVSVVFDLQRQSGAPTLAYGDTSTGIYVSQATVGSTKIDVKMDTNGKVANGNWTDWVQINNSLTVPVVEGSKVSIDDAYNQNNDWGTINGTTVNKTSKSVTIGSGVTKAEIVMGNGGYYRSFTVTYPVGTNFGTIGKTTP